MSRSRPGQSRSWWQATVARWKRSGLTAAEFGEREDVSPRTLRWWSSALSCGTRAERGQAEMGPAPIEILLPAEQARAHVEISVEGAVLRVEVGTDAAYVGALVQALRGVR
jgi:hypothetical protein